MMSVLFCKENVEIIQHVFMVCSEILPLYGIILVCIFIGKKKTKNIELALMLMMYYLVKCHSVVVTNLLIYNSVLKAILFLFVKNRTKKP